MRGIVPLLHGHDPHGRGHVAIYIRRREFIVTLGSAATAWPLAARAQQPDRVRRIGVLMLYPENDPEGQLRATAFRQGLEKLGWAVGRNVQIVFHWGLGDTDWIRSAAARLLALVPDVILANGDPAARTMQQSSRTVPVIFISGSDPVTDGLVLSLAHPDGNLTGFCVFEPSLGARLLELLKEIAPHVTRVAILLNPDNNPASCPLLRRLRPRGSRSKWRRPRCAIPTKSRRRWPSGGASRITD